MKIRPATPSDTQLLATLGAKTFYDTFSPYHSEEDMQAYLAKAYSEDAIAFNLRDPDIRYFIAEIDGRAVGYIKMRLNAVHEKLEGTRNIELEKIYVLHEYLDKKVGRDLMITAINEAKKENFERLFLGVWQDNLRAISFYKKAGFEVIGTRTFILGSQVCEDFIMALEL